MELQISHYVLLADSRPDKGFDLFLTLADLLPHVEFLAVSAEEDLATARETAAERSNVHIIGPPEDFDALFRAAACLAVPSYRHLELTGDICLEAQRHAKPVIGADRGNLPYLLERSGIVLPEDPRLWAAEIDRLLSDPAYYAKRGMQAFENSERYSSEARGAMLDRIVAGIDSSMLIGVGGGLGNMLHTTPMIRNIALRTGRPVDIVAAEDHSNSLSIMHNQEYVGAVYALRQVILQRRYDTVFLTHSFGKLRVAFNSDNVIWSSDWDVFRAHGTHETIHNLRSAKQLLGIPYDDSDTTGYFCGDLKWTPPAETLVGFHAGSKAGRWLAKRWPYFPELAARLTARGIRVASFGTADEYVEGTENRTGATIEAMCESMLDCSHFVANDSGVMNIANAMGIPMLALFAPTNVETRLPLRPTSAAIVLDKDCAPCELRDQETFQMGHCRCMADIGIDLVEEKLLEHIKAGGLLPMRSFVAVSDALV